MLGFEAPAHRLIDAVLVQMDAKSGEGDGAEWQGPAGGTVGDDVTDDPAPGAPAQEFDRLCVRASASEYVSAGLSYKATEAM